MPQPLFLILIVGVHWVFIVITGVVDDCDLDRINRDNLKVHPALIALDRFAFFHLIGVNDNRVIAFGTYNRHFQSSSSIRVRPPTYSNLFPYRMMTTALADTLLII
jgi:hypothetical protein